MFEFFDLPVAREAIIPYRENVFTHPPSLPHLLPTRELGLERYDGMAVRVLAVGHMVPKHSRTFSKFARRRLKPTPFTTIAPAAATRR
jgi:hypothetical protein